MRMIRVKAGCCWKNRIAQVIFWLFTAQSCVARGQQSPQAQFPNPVRTNTITVTVTNRDQQVVTDLKAADFIVYEDGEPQQVVSASLSDTPACVGIALDNSGSMRRIRSTVIGAIVLEKAAGQIRNPYSVTCSQNSANSGANRKITVKVNATGRNDLVVRMSGKSI